MSPHPAPVGMAGKIAALAYARRIYYGPRAVCIFPPAIPALARIFPGYPALT